MKKGAKILKKLRAAGGGCPAAISALKGKKLRKVCRYVYLMEPEKRDLVCGMLISELAYRTAFKGGGK